MSWVNADDSILDAFTTLEADAYGSSAPDDYIRALNHGAPGSRHRVTIDEHPTYITIGVRSAGPRRDGDSYVELVTAMRAATTDGIQPQLPPEISMMVWRHEGRELRVCAPGTAAALRRHRSRFRRGLSALSPFPLLGAIVQPLAGSATAVGIAVAPVLPPAHHPADPPAPVVRPITGEIARPPLPYTPGSIPPAAPPWSTRLQTQPPALLEFTAPDTAPSPTPTPTLPDRPPPTNSARQAPTPAATGQPTPVTTEEPTAVVSPPFELPPGPTVEPTNEGTPAPEPTITETSIVSAAPTLPVPHRKHHRWKKRHHPRGHH